MIIEKDKCTGCSACAMICGKDAISMVVDAEGFAYPAIDSSKCINCGLCEKVCPVIANLPACQPLATYAAMAKDTPLRMQSSSGGVFSLLARQNFLHGGIVYGAAYDETNWHVKHIPAENETELAKLRCSKYVQSDIGDTYRRVAESLSSGRIVLFSGTPCQAAALKSYLSLRKDIKTDTLLVVDFVCHAIPSSLAWKRYLETRVKFVYNGECGLRYIRSIVSRRKDCGWKQYSMSLSFANDKEYRKVFAEDSFMRGFLADLYNRPSCHNCPAKEMKSGSDITIADYWGVASKYPDFDDDKGTSLVIVNTGKGADALATISEMLNIQLSDFAHACKHNPAISRPTIPHRNREEFFRRLHNRQDFDKLVEQMLRPQFRFRVISAYYKIRRIGGNVLRKLGLRK